MKTSLLTLFSFLFICSVNAQTAFSGVDFSLKLSSSDKGTIINYKDSSLSMKFQLTQRAVQVKDNFLTVDSQLIQITTLAVDGFQKNLNTLNDSEQKEFLSNYSDYELDYFKNELKLEIINPNNQWVAAGSRKWFIWYFRVGNLDVKLTKKVQIQLFASTIVGGKVLTINAPTMVDGDFRKAGLIVNQIMESLTTIGK
jgi:hypothetical protein